MKIIFFGDSATDSKRIRTSNEAGRIPETYSIEPNTYGNGYVFLTAAQLFYEKPQYYQILNRGIGGDRLPQLYARIQLDVWNEKPDVLNILVGANDMVGEGNPNPTDLTVTENDVTFDAFSPKVLQFLSGYDADTGGSGGAIGTSRAQK
ncbi:MAG: hypothetical protein IKA72_01725, partial [Clostridia bacterium]|nr:hypothetical protein [Clostridia bacterium]